MTEYNDLVIDNNFGNWVICWSDDGDPGASLGEDDTFAEVKSIPTGEDVDREYYAAEIAAALLTPQPRRGSGMNHHYIWETEKEARKALREIKATMVSLLADTPWPDWAVKAKTAGWKAPKGWKP
jgi:hypothetical protein